MAKPKKERIRIEPYRWAPGDLLAPEYELVAQLIAQTLASGWWYYSEINLNTTEVGRRIQETDRAALARIVMALVAHAAHYDAFGKQVRDRWTNDLDRCNWYLSREWRKIWPPRLVASKTLTFLMRKKLPLERQQLIMLAEWMADADSFTQADYPINAFFNAVQAHGIADPADNELRLSLGRLIKVYRGVGMSDILKFADRLEKLLGSVPEVGSGSSQAVVSVQAGPKTPDPAQPALAGSSTVMVSLKQFLGLLPPDAVATEVVGADHFPLRADSPLRAEHEIIAMFLPEVTGTSDYHEYELAKLRMHQATLKRDPATLGRLMLAAAERYTHGLIRGRGGLAERQWWPIQRELTDLFRSFMAVSFRLDRAGAFDLLLFLSTLGDHRWLTVGQSVGRFLDQIEHEAVALPLTPGERHVLYRLRFLAIVAPVFGRPNQETARLTRLIGDNLLIGLVPGEVWSDAVNSELARLAPGKQEKWLALLQHAFTATAPRPSGKWLKVAQGHLKGVRADVFGRALLRWFPLVNAPRPIRLMLREFGGHSRPKEILHEDNATCLRGLAWMAPEVASAELARALGALAISAYRKVPGIGPRAVKVGNAAVYALSQIEDAAALGQLALLKVKIKFGTAQKEIEKAFNAAAERAGVPRDEIEEMSVPAYGLTEVGIGEEKMGEFTARLTVTGTTSTELVWVKADGKVQRAIPAAVKASHKEELKEIQTAAKDIQKMMPAQRERIDGLFLQQKTWPLTVWRERYLEHPLMGTLARRILWEFKTGERTVTALWFNGALVDLDLKPVEMADGRTTVELWHPIGKSTEEVVAWRSWLETQQIQQPFKQAHREIYVLTDAERNTGVYSNRYAAHVLKQHQFNALCSLRGWKNQLRLFVDAEYPPAALHLPQWGLRAEFWIEGIGTDYGTDTNESGTFLYLSTDQVRFYRVEAAQRTAHAGGGGYHPGYWRGDAEPLPLAEIPPLVFSEVMRDVDMFVGVASVGNDPAWSDGGPEGRYRGYWEAYSFGALNASAKTRKEVLERLVPKLKIASRCSFVDRYLVVKGSLRTYRIHLGSGNILMEPNDQYLCIVPRPGEVEGGGVLLPFEGDRTLSIVLSKAFLLCEDAKIKDETIVRQIRSR